MKYPGAFTVLLLAAVHQSWAFSPALAPRAARTGISVSMAEGENDGVMNKYSR